MRVYLDTNILYLVLRPAAERSPLVTWVEGAMRRFAAGDDAPVISPLVLDELAYRLLLARLRDEGGSSPLNALRADVAGALKRHGRTVAVLLDRVEALPGLVVAPVDASRSRRARELMTAHALLPRDAHHLAVAEAERCDALMSVDADFARSAAVVAWHGPPPGAT